MIYLWADTHFNHKNVIEYCKRPYSSVAEMNAALISAWNSRVGPVDTIYFLGDFGFAGKMEGTRPLEDIFAELRGHKHLVIGNHDEKNPKVLRLPWESQNKLVTIKEDSVYAEACHYPLESWKMSHHGAIMLHGHCHGNLKRAMPHRFDVGVDVYEEPVPLYVLARAAAAQTFEPTDHHE